MSSQEKKHTLLKAIGLTAAAGAAAYGGYGYYIFRTFFDLSRSSLHTGGPESLPYGYGARQEWLDHSDRQDVFIDSFDGLKLHGHTFTNHSDSHRWMITVHDAGKDYHSLMDMIYEADHRGYNVLAIDQRACGMSEGRYTSLGWVEHYDVISWVNWLVRNDSQAQIVLYGTGVGGDTVMNCVGDFMPKNVRAAIEDSGSAGVQETVLQGIRLMHKIDGKLFMPSVDMYLKQFLHFSMLDISTKHQLQNARIPVFFVHGGEDEIIPTSMVFDNFYSCSAVKEIYVVEGAAHLQCHKAEDYYQRIFNFVDTYINI